MKGNSARKQRAVKATDSEWNIVLARARAARMSASGYVVRRSRVDQKRAFQDEGDGQSIAGTPPTSPLVFTPKEQRDLFRNFEELGQRLVGMFFSRMDGGPPLVDAVQLICLLRNEELPFDMRDRN